MREQLVSEFMRFVRVDSESGNERPLLDLLSATFEERLRATCSIGEDGNLIARIPAVGSDVQQPILLGAHADTVRPGRGIEPILDDGVIRTDGSTILGADDKAAIAEILIALEIADRRPPVEVLITHGEEIGLLGANALDRGRIESSIGFIFDTSEPNSIVIGGPTYIAVDVEIRGTSAHAGLRPEQGVSAIAVAADALNQLQLGRLDAETTANIGTIEAGTVRNAVPDRAFLQGECRSFDHERCMAVAEDMRHAFTAAAERAGAEASVNLRVDYEASVLPKSSAAVALAIQALRAGGLEPNIKTLLGGTDAIVLQKKGIEVVVMGYGGRLAHSTKEHIFIDDMETVCRTICRLLEIAAST